jgi:hypothetical protein
MVYRPVMAPGCGDLRSRSPPARPARVHFYFILLVTDRAVRSRAAIARRSWMASAVKRPCLCAFLFSALGSGTPSAQVHGQSGLLTGCLPQPAMIACGWLKCLILLVPAEGLEPPTP